MHFLDVPQLAPPMQYATRSVIGLALLLYARPWRWYPALRVRHLPISILAGFGVFLIWVGPEMTWMPEFLRDLYIRWGVRPLGEPREALDETPYAPAVCGWTMTVIRLAGSGLLIPFIEEFFWRGFLQRWVLGGEFWKQDAGQLDVLRFLAVAFIFGIEHNEWLAGFLAGIVYGALYLRTRDVWAVGIAHAITNLILGAYVIRAGAWQFW